MMSRLRLFLIGWSLVLFALAIGCGKGGQCVDGVCACKAGASCDLVCDAPPCKVECEGNNPECNGACANADCSCGPGSQCALTCDAPPCHVECTDSTCAGECANGNCECNPGASCDFRCNSGPCHVNCVGGNAKCDGQCANGSCNCGPDSLCQFECTDANCHFNCEVGSACIATCPGGTPGNQGCAFDQCAAGEPVICPDGQTIVCGAECPPVEPEDG